MRRLAILALAVAPLLPGCASKVLTVPDVAATFETTPPEAWEVPSLVHSARPFRDVWYGLLDALKEDGFGLEAIDIESGTIRASFNRRVVDEFIDCGRSSRTYREAGRQTEFDYAIASDSTYETGYNFANCAATRRIGRDATLDGYVDVLVSEEDEGIAVSIAIEYVLTVESSGTYNNICPDGMLSGSVDTHTRQVRLTSFEDGRADFGVPGQPVEVVCTCKGKLEREVLALVE